MKRNGLLKNLLMIGLATIPVLGFSEINWSSTAQVQEQTSKPKLLYFMTDESSLCLEFKEDVLSDVRIQDMLNNDFLPIKINASEESSKRILRQYGVITVPTIIVLDGDKEDRRLARTASRESVISFLRGEKVIKMVSNQSTGMETLMSAADQIDDPNQADIDMIRVSLSKVDSSYIFSIKCAGEISDANIARYFFLINTDGSDSTGFRIGDFSGGDFLVQGQQVHRFTGESPDVWKWEQVGAAEFRNDGVELIFGVDQSLFGSTPTSLAAITQDSSWGNFDMVILSSSVASSSTTPAANSTPTTTNSAAPVSSETPYHEQFFQDTENTSIGGEYDLTNVWVASKTNEVDFAIKYRADPRQDGLHIFMNTDNNIQTGYQSHDKAGADFMIEGKNLYRFAGSNADEWAWNPITADLKFQSIPSGLRFSIPKSRASILDANGISFWVSMTDTNWAEVEYFPKTGTANYKAGGTQ